MRRSSSCRIVVPLGHPVSRLKSSRTLSGRAPRDGFVAARLEWDRMAIPLLDTKFYAPRRREGRVARPSLTERLDRGAHAKLTLVSAPAGFGKSTLVAEWLPTATTGSVGAWLSLDPADNHPTAFWAHVVVALQKVLPGVGCERARRPRRSRASRRGHPDAPAERPGRPHQGRGAGARRLSRHRCARGPGRSGVPARSPSGPSPPGDHDPSGSRVPAGPAPSSK